MRPLYQVLPSVGARARLAISFSRRRHSCRRGAIAAETATAAPRTHTLDHHRTKKFPPDGEGRRPLPLTPPPPPSLCRRRSLLWLSDYFLWYSREIAIYLTRLPHRKWSPSAVRPSNDGNCPDLGTKSPTAGGPTATATSLVSLSALLASRPGPRPTPSIASLVMFHACPTGDEDILGTGRRLVVGRVGRRADGLTDRRSRAMVFYSRRKREGGCGRKILHRWEN